MKKFFNIAVMCNPAGRLAAAFLLCAAACVFAGCSSTRCMYVPQSSIENVFVALAPGRTLTCAIQVAAVSRRWVPEVREDGMVRCTLSQRKNLVVVDVVPNGPQSFSIRPVECNIPPRKYDQWVNNLIREIMYRAGL